MVISRKRKLALVWMLWALTAVIVVAHSKCPADCRCDADPRGRKRTVCSKGGLRGSLPIQQIDKTVEILVITAPSDNPNVLTIGRVFDEFESLVEIHITHSLIPAIGENTFWGATNVLTLNLTNNNLTHLVDANFRGLDNLQNLHLDDNRIASMPSVPFGHLKNLRNLTLARNNLTQLVPRMFYLIPKLELLDLSGNPLSNVETETFTEMQQLRRLYMSRCELIRVDHILTLLPELEILDLSYNRIKFLWSSDLKPLRRLKELYLHGNELTNILENTFNGYDLNVLTLASNQLHNIYEEAFNNATVHELDISYNWMNLSDPDFLRPLADRLTKLDLSGNRITADTLSELLDRLPQLKELGIMKLNLFTLDPHELQFPLQLRKLNLSSNHLVRFPAALLRPLHRLEVLDLSRNQFRGLEHSFIEQVDGMHQIRTLHLHGNPWSCDACSIPALLAWLNNSRYFDNACSDLHRPQCLKCAEPYNLSGRVIQFLDASRLEPCVMGDRFPERTVAGFDTHVGIIVACAIIVLLLVTVTIILMLYYRRGADYYTHEEEREDDGIYENPAIDEENGDLLDGKRPRIATIESMDEFKDDYKYPQTGVLVCSGLGPE